MSPKDNLAAEFLFPSTEGGKLISMEDFSKLEPTDIEIIVVKAVKKIVSILSHDVKHHLNFFRNIKLR